jgi:hypothetical protein
MATTPQPQKHDPRQDSDKPYRPDDEHQHGDQQQSRPGPDQDQIREQRAAEARKLFDENDSDDLPVTTQTDQLRRSMEMEQVGPTAWMNEQERRIRERQGDPAPEPRQVHGVAATNKPR